MCLSVFWDTQYTTHSICILRPGALETVHQWRRKKRAENHRYQCKTETDVCRDVVNRKEKKWAKSFRSRGRFVAIGYAPYSFEWFASKSLVRIIIYRIWQVKHQICMCIFVRAHSLARSFACTHVLSVHKLISMRRDSRIFFYGHTRTYAYAYVRVFVHTIN